MIKKFHLVCLLVLCVLAVGTASAQTITMANPMGLSERDMVVYWPNGSMQGFYNSTSIIELDNTSDYIFTMKPVQMNPLEDPIDWLSNDALPFIQTYILGIFLIIVLAAFWKAR